MESDRKVHEFKGDDELQEALISGYKFNQGDFVEMPEDFDENKTIATYVVDYAVEEDCVNLLPEPWIFQSSFPRATKRKI